MVQQIRQYWPDFLLISLVFFINVQLAVYTFTGHFVFWPVMAFIQGSFMVCLAIWFLFYAQSSK